VKGYRAPARAYRAPIVIGSDGRINADPSSSPDGVSVTLEDGRPAFLIRLRHKDHESADLYYFKEWPFAEEKS